MSGAHSGGLATTVFPAASAGAIRQVASISGAFHGVMTAVTPDGAQDTSSRCPRISRSPPSSSPSQSAKNRKFCAARGITLRRCERSSAPLSAVSTAASSAARASMPSAIACSTAARSFGGVADQPPNASPGRPHRRRHLGLAAARHLGQRPLVDGGQVGEGGGGRDPLAADPVPRVNLYPGHVRGAHDVCSTFPPSQVTPTCW